MWANHFGLALTYMHFASSFLIATSPHRIDVGGVFVRSALIDTVRPLTGKFRGYDLSKKSIFNGSDGWVYRCGRN